MATKASTDVHVGEERVEANDAILIKGVVVIVAGPSTAQLNTTDHHSYINDCLLKGQSHVKTDLARLYHIQLSKKKNK